MSDRHTKAKIVVELTKQELTTLLNALNETLEAVEPWEFSTRVGVEISAVQELRARLSGIADAEGS